MSSYQWMSVFLLIYILNQNNVQPAGLYSQSVSLTTSNPTQNGASIQILNSNDVNSRSSRWDFSSSTQIGYPVRIRLDNTWGFHPTQVSTIQLTMDSSTSLNVADLDTCMAFSVNAQNFISLSIRLDGADNNFIYPRCSQSQYITIVSGDVKALVDYNGAQYEGTPDYRRYWRYHKQFARTDGYDMLPDIVNYRDNSFPTIFKLTNDPIQNRLHLSYTNPIWQQNYANFSQDCQYTSFDPELGLDIYFGVDQNGETMNILNPITIRYYYQMTDNPTVTPTNNPSNHPTVSPSDYPSFLPSKYPTNLPSYSPTFLPSNYPTFLPSNYPTLSPSNYPINSPSNPPTFLPSNPPTNVPSDYPASSPSYRPTTLQTETPTFHSGERFDSTTTSFYDENAISNTENQYFTEYIFIIAGVVCLCFIMFGIVVGLTCIYRLKKQIIGNNANIISNIDSTSNTSQNAKNTGSGSMIDGQSTRYDDTDSKPMHVQYAMDSSDTQCDLNQANTLQSEGHIKLGKVKNINNNNDTQRVAILSVELQTIDIDVKKTHKNMDEYPESDDSDKMYEKSQNNAATTTGAVGE